MKRMEWIVGTFVSASLCAAIVVAQQAPQQQALPPDTAGLGAATGGRPASPPPPPAVMPPPVTPIVSMTAPNPDPRVGLKAGRWDAGQAAWNMRMLSQTPPSEASAGS